MPTPSARDRYKGGTYHTWTIKPGYHMFFTENKLYPGYDGEAVTANDETFFKYPSRIELRVSGNDTVYIETPSHNRFLSPFIKKNREVDSRNRGTEYEILKRRFKEAKLIVNKKQQGGQLNMDEQQVQQQIIQLVQAAMSGDEEAALAIQQIMQAAQQGDQEAMKLAQMIQQVAQSMLLQEGVLAARFGAKLNYIRHLKGKCPTGYEMGYYKAGGRVCKKCMKKASSGAKVKKPVPMDPVEAFKCGRRMRKK